jgi:hypothetical protein
VPPEIGLAGVNPALCMDLYLCSLCCVVLCSKFKCDEVMQGIQLNVQRIHRFRVKYISDKARDSDLSHMINNNN